MSMRAYSKKTREKIKKLIKDHVEACRINIPWSGENDVVTKKIMNLFKETSWHILHFMCILWYEKWEIN